MVVLIVFKKEKLIELTKKEKLDELTKKEKLDELTKKEKLGELTKINANKLIVLSCYYNSLINRDCICYSFNYFILFF